jgi:hypothetical protein
MNPSTAPGMGPSVPLRSGVSCGFVLKLAVNTYQRTLLNLQSPIDRIYEERKLAAAFVIRFSGAFYLPVGKFNAHFREHKPRLCKINGTRRNHINQQINSTNTTPLLYRSNISNLLTSLNGADPTGPP